MRGLCKSVKCSKINGNHFNICIVAFAYLFFARKHLKNNFKDWVEITQRETTNHRTCYLTNGVGCEQVAKFRIWGQESKQQRTSSGQRITDKILEDKTNLYLVDQIYKNYLKLNNTLIPPTMLTGSRLPSIIFTCK